MVIEKRLLELVLKIEACDTMENEETCRQKMDALLLFSPHSWQLGKKCDSSCFFTLNRSSLGLDSLVFSVMEPTYLQNLSLGLDDSLAGSIVLSMEVLSMEVFRFISSCTNLYSDTQDSPVLQGFTSRIYDLSAFVAVCLTLLVVIISTGISKLVYKVDCQELTNLLSESWSFDVHRILLAIRSFIFSFVALYAHFVCCCAYAQCRPWTEAEEACASGRREIMLISGHKFYKIIM
ncbi:hypothetical protein HID58_061621 [Brassica napus]|uniref:CASP-like protein n=1 Tax=Brassica napus TaxID=3708 RepID=A0ABQ7ZZ35_BRANA|nr:hypothetical protein HID58_061621 [Brassica napus]